MTPQELFATQLDQQRRAQRAGRWVMAGIGMVVVFGLFLCGGLLPALFAGPSAVTTGKEAHAASRCDLGESVANLPVTGIDDLNAQQINNARTIVTVGEQMGIAPWGWVIAIATAMQESGLKNLPHLGNRNDHDSIGLFQQRPSQGWGTEAQLLDPSYSSRKFYTKLVTVEGWEKLELTVAAQKVQRSAFPDAYRKHEPLAMRVVNEVTEGKAFRNGRLGGSPLCAEPGTVSASGWTMPTLGPVGSGFRTAERPTHDGVDIIVPRFTSIRAAAAGTVGTVECNASTSNCDVDGSPQIRGCGWYVEIDHGNNVMTRYCHMVRRPELAVGDRVRAGQLIGEVGSSGNSSGPHLHFEVHAAGKPINPEAFMSTNGAPLRAKSL